MCTSWRSRRPTPQWRTRSGTLTGDSHNTGTRNKNGPDICGRIATTPVRLRRRPRTGTPDVENNPVRAGMVKYAEDFEWSSARAHLGQVTDGRTLDEGWWQVRWSVQEWKQMLLNLADQEHELRAIREATYTGRPSGRRSSWLRWARNLAGNRGLVRVGGLSGTRIGPQISWRCGPPVEWLRRSGTVSSVPLREKMSGYVAVFGISM